MKGMIAGGIVAGNGAAINVDIGFIPDFVELFNMTDGDRITSAFLQWVIPFTSGGTTEVLAGHRIKGATSKATAIVEAVLLTSGTFAGGDAAGFFVVQEGSLTGTFGSENVFIDSDETSGTNDATVTVNVVHNMETLDTGSGATDLAIVTGNSAISRYEGSAGSAGKGFTIGSTIAEEAKCLRYVAYRFDQVVHKA